MNPGTYACAGFDKSASCSGNSMASSPGIPISMARVGDKGTVVSISGTEVKAVCEASGSVILDVKGSKIAIDRKMASKILFCPES